MALLGDIHLLAPDHFAGAVASRSRDLGCIEAVIYLVDYEQLLLQPLRGEGVPPRQELSMDTSLGGRAFRSVVMVTAPATSPGPQRIWMPLLDGVERLGVMELLARRTTDDDVRRLEAFVALVTELLVVNDQCTDIFARLRRRKTLSMAAEMQWDLSLR